MTKSLISTAGAFALLTLTSAWADPTTDAIQDALAQRDATDVRVDDSRITFDIAGAAGLEIQVLTGNPFAALATYDARLDLATRLRAPLQNHAPPTLDRRMVGTFRANTSFVLSAPNGATLTRAEAEQLLRDVVPAQSAGDRVLDVAAWDRQLAYSVEVVTAGVWSLAHDLWTGARMIERATTEQQDLFQQQDRLALDAMQATFTNPLGDDRDLEVADVVVTGLRPHTRLQYSQKYIIQNLQLERAGFVSLSLVTRAFGQMANPTTADYRIHLRTSVTFAATPTASTVPAGASPGMSGSVPSSGGE